MVIAVPLHQLDRGIVQRAQTGRGERLFLAAVRDDAAVFQEDDTRDLGRDFVDVVGDQGDGLACLHQVADGVQVMEACSQVEAAGRLVEHEGLRVVDERAPEEKAALLAGGHSGVRLIFQPADAERVEYGVGTGGVVGAQHVVGRDVDAGVEARQQHVQAAGVAGVLALQVVRDDAEPAAQFPDVPALPAVEAHEAARGADRIQVAGQQLQKGGFASAVGAEDDGVLTLDEVQRQLVEHPRPATIDRGVFDLDYFLHEWGLSFVGGVGMRAE